MLNWLLDHTFQALDATAGVHRVGLSCWELQGNEFVDLLWQAQHDSSSGSSGRPAAAATPLQPGSSSSSRPVVAAPAFQRSSSPSSADAECVEVRSADEAQRLLALARCYSRNWAPEPGAGSGAGGAALLAQPNSSHAFVCLTLYSQRDRRCVSGGRGRAMLLRGAGNAFTAHTGT